MTTQEAIEMHLKPTKKIEYKTIVIKLTVRQLEDLKTIAGTISQHRGKYVSKNTLIQDAIDAFIQDAEEQLDKIGVEQT